MCISISNWIILPSIRSGNMENIYSGPISFTVDQLLVSDEIYFDINKRLSTYTIIKHHVVVLFLKIFDKNLLCYWLIFSVSNIKGKENWLHCENLYLVYLEIHTKFWNPVSFLSKMDWYFVNKLYSDQNQFFIIDNFSQKPNSFNRNF